ncbi:MAG TPA: NAD-dependent epimerase/dehydratase family protein [Gemmatimonadaceae bacterium]|nr:NAD-dependent epimerase/dehydratase family protein [Gemmatimonadaceae bacterium]
MSASFTDIHGRRVLVTGGLGFCGLNMVRYLAHRLECQVTVLDDLSNSSMPREDLPRTSIVVGDVRDESVVAPLLRQHEYVFHLACRTILSCAADPLGDLDVNAMSTLKMLELLRAERPRDLRRFVYTSSTSIYGNSRHVPTDELDPPNILNHYAATKLLGEHYTLLYHTAYDVPTACVRYSNIFGPGQTTRNPYCGVVGKFIEAALDGRPLTVHGDGEQTRDYTYIDDAVEATIFTAVSPKALGDIFNIGTGVETSVNVLAEEIRSLTGRGGDVEIQHIDRRDIDNIRRRAISPEKIRVRLGWQPQTRLREGLKRTIEHARAERYTSRDLTSQSGSGTQGRAGALR